MGCGLAGSMLADHHSSGAERLVHNCSAPTGKWISVTARPALLGFACWSSCSAGFLSSWLLWLRRCLPPGLMHNMRGPVCVHPLAYCPCARACALWLFGLLVRFWSQRPAYQPHRTFQDQLQSICAAALPGNGVRSGRHMVWRLVCLCTRGFGLGPGMWHQRWPAGDEVVVTGDQEGPFPRVLVACVK